MDGSAGGEDEPKPSGGGMDPIADLEMLARMEADVRGYLEPLGLSFAEVLAERTPNRPVLAGRHGTWSEGRAIPAGFEDEDEDYAPGGRANLLARGAPQSPFSDLSVSDEGSSVRPRAVRFGGVTVRVVMAHDSDSSDEASDEEEERESEGAGAGGRRQNEDLGPEPFEEMTWPSLDAFSDAMGPTEAELAASAQVSQQMHQHAAGEREAKGDESADEDEEEDEAGAATRFAAPSSGGLSSGRAADGWGGGAASAGLWAEAFGEASGSASPSAPSGPNGSVSSAAHDDVEDDDSMTNAEAQAGRAARRAPHSQSHSPAPMSLSPASDTEPDEADTARPVEGGGDLVQLAVRQPALSPYLSPRLVMAGGTPHHRPPGFPFLDDDSSSATDSPVPGMRSLSSPSPGGAVSSPLASIADAWRRRQEQFGSHP